MNIGTSFSVLGWVVILGVIAYVFLRTFLGKGKGGLNFVWLILAVVLGVALMTAGNGLVYINPEERGVVLSALSPTGIRAEELQPGLRWVVPYFETVRRYPISRQTYTMSIMTGEGQVRGDDSILARTIDGQEVTVDASVIYTLDPTKIVDVHIRWQDRYTDGLVRPLARGIIRDAVAKYRVEEVVSTQRLAMTQGISEEMKRRMSDEGLVLVDFILRNITFSKEYAASVEQKQVAQQQAEQAKYLVQKQQQEAERQRVEATGQRDAAITRAEGDAQSQIVRAKADAESLRLISVVLNENPSLLNYRYVEKLAPNVQIMLLPSSAAGGNPLILDLKQFTGSATTPITK